MPPGMRNHRWVAFRRGFTPAHDAPHKGAGRYTLVALARHLYSVFGSYDTCDTVSDPR